LGKVESEVGAFARGRRDQLVLVTKFGLQVKKASGIVSAAQGLARTVLAAVPPLRRVVRNRSGMFYAPKCFDAAAARRSLEESLRAMKTDYIDVFLLHEPELNDVSDSGVWEYLEQVKAQGLIRAWGLAGYPPQVMPICEEIPGLADVIQIPNDVVNRQLENFHEFSDSGLITFSPYSEAYGEVQRLVCENTGAVQDFARVTGIDLGRRGVLARMMLGYCLFVNPSGVTLFFSGRQERVHENADAWKTPVPVETVRAFEELVAQLLASEPSAPGKYNTN
jgi:D-threo-aldose 1-dehydrogenase